MGPHYDSPESQYPGTPRSYRPTMAERDSVASTNAPFSSIGALLSQPYDSDDEDGRSIKHPQAYQGSRLEPQLRQGDVRQQFNQGAAASIKSSQGIVVQERPRSVVHFPGPTIGQQNYHNPPYSAGPTFQPQYPNPTHPGPRGGQTARPQPRLNIPGQRSMSPHPLPMPKTPISPALAAPPSAAPSTSSFSQSGHLAPPRSAFAKDSRSSVASSFDSIAGYDTMKEKHTLMRGGEEEVFMPMNPRRPAKKGMGSRTTMMGFRKTVFGQPGGEFWKRFSVMAKMEDFGKDRQVLTCTQVCDVSLTDSEWLAAEQARKRRIKIYAIVGIVLIAVVIAGVVLGVLLTDNSHEDARPKSMTRPSDD